MNPALGVAIIAVAAGRGSRLGGDIPKQYRKIAGKPLLARTLESLSRATPAIILPVIHEDDTELYRLSVVGLQDNPKLMAPAYGGATRQASVRLGLEALLARKAAPKIVLIHDAARLFVSGDLVANAIAGAEAYGAAIPGLTLLDTIKEIDENGIVISTAERERLRSVQTPQAFDFKLIFEAHRHAASKGVTDLPDDAAVAEFAGHRVHIFPGESANVKITTSEDLKVAEEKLMRELTDVRTGQGYDVHAFEPGDHIWLGGVRIAHSQGLKGHSDADVLSHAITDALLGAIADGDIGSHFPPSDPQWRGAPSRIFLEAAAAGISARGGAIAHIDATIVCERPKIGPHRDAIRASLADILGIDIGRLALKATTSEGLGFTGREEGIASLAIATVRLPV